jgi:hypothetical protein
MCTFYGRDRLETGVDFKVALTFKDFLEQVDNCGADYYYIMKDGIWYAGSVYDADGLVTNGLTLLSDALATLHAQEAEVA